MPEEPNNLPFRTSVIATTGVAAGVPADPVTAPHAQSPALTVAEGAIAMPPHGPIGKPSLVEMAASFTTSMAKLASSGFKTVDRDSFRVRAEQCLSCEHRQGSRCKVCGCFFDLKARLPHEDCPIGRWTS